MSCCEGRKKSEPFTRYSIVEAGKSIIRHFTDPTYDAFTNEEEKKMRLEACSSCENFDTFMGKKQCKICLCFLDAKASLVDQTCPHPQGDRWQRKESQ